jgi:hypothetical protein
VEKEGSLTVVIEGGEFDIEWIIAPTRDVFVGVEVEDAITEGCGLQHDLERFVGEEVLGVKDVDGPAVDADPHGAVGIGEEGSLVGVAGDQAIALSEESPMCAVEDVNAEIGSDPEPAALVEADELHVGGGDLRGVEDGEQAASASVDAEMKESG